MGRLPSGGDRLLVVSGAGLRWAMDEALFIDHVDLEWGLRARRHGWHLGVAVGAVLGHSLGEDTRHVLWRSRDVHIQHPLRNYYTVRNTIWLVRTKEPPRSRLGMSVLKMVVCPGLVCGGVVRCWCRCGRCCPGVLSIGTGRVR